MGKWASRRSWGAMRGTPWLPCLCLASLASLASLGFVNLPRRARDCRVQRFMDQPGASWYCRNARGVPNKAHLPTGGPNITKTADLLEIRTSYAEDPGLNFKGERELMRKLSSAEAAERREATEKLLSVKFGGRPQRRTLLRFLELLFDEDLLVRHNMAYVLHGLCENFRWEMDEWVAKLAMRVHPQSEYSLMEQIYTMKAMQILGPYASSYSHYLTRFFEHEEDYVRMVVVQTIGRMTLQVGRHKHALVRLLRQDTNQEVRKMADLVLKQRGWKKPKWMEIQTPTWRTRVIRSKANNNRGTRRGKNNEGKFNKIYWEKVQR